jgi:hypothetical protein
MRFLLLRGPKTDCKLTLPKSYSPIKVSDSPLVDFRHIDFSQPYESEIPPLLSKRKNQVNLPSPKLTPKLAENPGSIASEYSDFEHAIIGNSP